MPGIRFLITSEDGSGMCAAHHCEQPIPAGVMPTAAHIQALEKELAHATGLRVEVHEWELLEEPTQLKFSTKFTGRLTA